MRSVKVLRIGLMGKSLPLVLRNSSNFADVLARLNVARLANVPRSVIELAAVKSQEMEENVTSRKLGNFAKLASKVLDAGDAAVMEHLVSGIETL